MIISSTTMQLLSGETDKLPCQSFACASEGYASEIYILGHYWEEARPFCDACSRCYVPDTGEYGYTPEDARDYIRLCIARAALTDEAAGHDSTYGDSGLDEAIYYINYRLSKLSLRGSYNVETGELTPPTGWSSTPPVSSEPLGEIV